MDTETFEDIFDDISCQLKEESQLEILSKRFSLLQTDEERYNFVLPFMDGIQFTQQENFKSESKANSLREEGNKLFGKKSDLQALFYYSDSVAYAPSNSQSLTLAFANRSAVLKSLGHHEECITDIKRSLESDYPENLKHKLLTRQGECFINIGQTKKALECFQLAKEYLAKSDLLPEKLQEFKNKIENNIKMCDATKERNPIIESVLTAVVPPQTSYDQNKEILSASDCIEIQYSEDIGRHVVATRDIDPGDVLVVEKSYASLLLPECVRTHCSHCLKRCPALLPCLHCTLAMYCSESCRDNSWKSYHETECSSMDTIDTLDMGKMTLLAVRILTVSGTKFLSNYLKNTQDESTLKNNEEKRKLGFNTDGKYDSLDFNSIYYLITNTQIRSTPDLFKRSLMAACVLKSLNLHELPDSSLYGGLILRLLQSLPCNAHEISEMCKSPSNQVGQNNEIGAAAYAMLSLLNHSCDPNVVRHSYGTSAVLRAIKPIKKGDQIVDNYGYHYAVHSKLFRQTHLKNQYLFTCNCEACTNSWPLHKNLPISATIENPKDQEALQVACKDALAGNITDDTLDQFFLCLKYLEQYGARLCQQYNCCQEAIKQHFAKTGNYCQFPY